MMTLLKVNQITKSFGKFKALNGVEFTVNEGEIFGFIGPNGSGKSTTIKAILGMLKTNSGTIEVFGKDAWTQAVEIHENIAYVPGDVNLWPNLTGGEVIDLFLKLSGTKNNEKRDALIKKFDLDPTKKCSSYSKGNRQKIALIAAFATNADLLILDEPTSGLDPLMEQVFQECVLEKKREGKSILLSSHILSEVEKLCDRVGIIRKGEIVETGSLNDLRHLTRMHFVVQTKEKLTALEQQVGVHDITIEEDTYHFQVDSKEVSNVIKYLGQFELMKLESMPPTLEDLFMRHYGEDIERGE
ncbi:ABC transporter ATP-binding protein [Mammaliicoccus stepanovicii]|uniref:Putative ABC transporter ATP-binding protein n=2 Tax=Mammaliicoccus stepanovicii TaxID=643214 RepID=A0A240A689_9STAP|nr:ABC transporter ATP-binding protein [Mammaliicoccus stepanovicii]SNV78837.1 putative ABC transporter ATP-binding protein [Mammaliicoccus stepanovicii]